jgi:RNA ligase
MKLYDLFSQQDFEQQIADGMVKVTSHPTENLRIANYTQKAQFSPDLWNHVTDLCRGIIFRADTLEVIARPFAKFWNLGDARHPETLPENLPSTPPTITRKMDGSLGIAYKIGDGWAVATRGSFSSEQAIWATQWIKENPPMLETDGTMLFEIIYPENQIVVKYTYSGLVLLALVDIETGQEAPYWVTEAHGHANGYRVVEMFGKPLQGLSEEDTPNEEGYVAAWDRPGGPPLRVKIKHATYCRLHRLLTGTNAVTIWEMLRDGSDIAALTIDVPADFKTWIGSVEARLRGEFSAIEQQAMKALFLYPGEKTVTTPEQRKDFALYAVKQQPVTPLLFAMLDGKEYGPIIWKMIRPRGDEKTFKVDSDL